jgi:hypothetical protein
MSKVTALPEAMMISQLEQLAPGETPPTQLAPEDQFPPAAVLVKVLVKGCA